MTYIRTVALTGAYLLVVTTSLAAPPAKPNARLRKCPADKVVDGVVTRAEMDAFRARIGN